MDALTRERFEPTPRGSRQPDPIDEIIERRRILLGDEAYHLAARADALRTRRLRAARLAADRALAKVIRRRMDAA